MLVSHKSYYFEGFLVFVLWCYDTEFVTLLKIYYWQSGKWMILSIFSTHFRFTLISIYFSLEMSEKQTSAIQKIRQLQANDISCIMDSGTYVQCCDCQKWR